jgi:hypothetical protein
MFMDDDDYLGTDIDDGAGDEDTASFLSGIMAGILLPLIGVGILLMFGFWWGMAQLGML